MDYFLRLLSPLSVYCCTMCRKERKKERKKERLDGGGLVQLIFPCCPDAFMRK